MKQGELLMGAAMPDGDDVVVARKIDTAFGVIFERAPARLLSDHATAFMLPLITVPHGARAADAGCGTGVLAIYMAMAGAAGVVGTDTDREALAAARAGAAAGGVTNVRFIEGSLLSPVPGPLDIVAALLPHKPSPAPFNPRFHGGPDGTDLLLPLIEQAREKLVRGGSLFLYVNSVANTARVRGELARGFDVSVCGEKKRYFTREELDGLAPGMFAQWSALREAGKAEFDTDGAGMFFRARVYEARRT